MTYCAGHAAIVGQRRLHEEVDGVDRVGELCGLEQRLARVGDAAVALGVAETYQDLDAFQRVSAAVAVEVLERLGVPSQCFVGRQLIQGAGTGEFGVVDGLVGVGRLNGPTPVVGEFTGVPISIGGGLEGDGHCAVGAAPTSW